jgi:hypothetical protein
MTTKLLPAALVAAIMAAPAMAGHHPYPICDKFDPHYPCLRHDNSRPEGTDGVLIRGSRHCQYPAPCWFRSGGANAPPARARTPESIRPPGRP